MSKKSESHTYENRAPYRQAWEVWQGHGLHGWRSTWPTRADARAAAAREAGRRVVRVDIPASVALPRIHVA